MAHATYYVYQLAYALTYNKYIEAMFGYFYTLASVCGLFDVPEIVRKSYCIYPDTR